MTTITDLLAKELKDLNDSSIIIRKELNAAIAVVAAPYEEKLNRLQRRAKEVKMLIRLYDKYLQSIKDDEPTEPA